MERILAEAFGHDARHLATEEKQLLLSRLLARLAHEIRNPLSSLDIHVQLLEEDLARLPVPASEQAAARLEIIHGELHRLENIVKHFLRLARPSELDLAPVDVAELVRRVCALLQPEAQAQQTELAIELPAALPGLLADGAQLTQVLVNLVVNALQAVGRGGRVEVRAAAVPAGNELVVEVRDSGPGIAPDKLEAVFEPYYTTKAEGSGLGLWIAQQIVMAHKGALRAGNLSGGGAVFTLRLPLPSQEAGHG
jgi:two-component system, NtrC family, sensor histidine kinase HydH